MLYQVLRVTLKIPRSGRVATLNPDSLESKNKSMKENLGWVYLTRSMRLGLIVGDTQMAPSSLAFSFCISSLSVLATISVLLLSPPFVLRRPSQSGLSLWPSLKKYVLWKLYRACLIQLRRTQSEMYIQDMDTIFLFTMHYNISPELISKISQ